MNWLPLITEEQLIDITLLSQKNDIKAVVLLKHSTRCSISSMALNRLERSWKLSEMEVPTYLLDLLNYRNISNKIESVFSIPHESPQVLVIKNGKCIYAASHSDISASDIEAAINN
ncbi:MAG: bacillithiol system redox-active protein YtxJ [Bacteroidetes bacterium]|nr:bacillithiol system redox-active protein YtxJ [Bacteroidota bacterium]